MLGLIRIPCHSATARPTFLAPEVNWSITQDSPSQRNGNRWIIGPGSGIKFFSGDKVSDACDCGGRKVFRYSPPLRIYFLFLILFWRVSLILGDFRGILGWNCFFYFSLSGLRSRSLIRKNSVALNEWGWLRVSVRFIFSVHRLTIDTTDFDWFL